MTKTHFSLEVQPVIPPRLHRLTELANNLFYGWDRSVRGLFFRLDRALWESCGHNPKVFLRRVSQTRLEEAAEDRIYMEEYHRVLSAYDSYHSSEIKTDIQEMFDPTQDLIAYFCAEFGLHESVQLYSGGLGILAGDHCKAASDLGLPFVAIGMLYRQGYFTQTIDGHGSQVAHYVPTDFDDLPIDPATDRAGNEIHVSLGLPGRQIMLKVWKARAGRVTLYLLDSDLPENSEADRRITYQLYGGDAETRMLQELVLGIGGVRALRALGLEPTVWHINEGHPAFMILERCRELVDDGLDFDSALEAVAANTVFTTHTPVPAGHDIFGPEMMRAYFLDFASECGIGLEQLMVLGANSGNHGGFDMTALGLRGSRYRNGVSRIHGSVAAHMAAHVWPQVPPEESPLAYITNGVHVPTFLAREWTNLLDMRFGGGWRNELLNEDYWDRIDTIPDHSFWSLRQSLKSEMLAEVRTRVTRQMRRNGCSTSLIERLTNRLSPTDTDVLTIGFARRFATYKRATLIFSDPQRLARLLSDPARPGLLVFAGKAHPHDKPAQEFIRTIHNFSRRPEFEGRIILVEGYDQALARKLISGVDVWLNNPEFPLEACGTSGQKAGINGVLNLSVLDGWWGEGYDGTNGWAITPHGPETDPAYRDREEAQELLDLLEHQIIPLYYERAGHGYSEGWVRKSKASMKTLMPRFNALRMLMDYAHDYYTPACRQRQVMTDKDYARAREVASWRRKIDAAWPKVRIRRLDVPLAHVTAGTTVPIRVAVDLNGLKTDDILVECLVGIESESGGFEVQNRHIFTAEGCNPDGECLFRLDLEPSLPGLQAYQIRAFPFHPCLSHRFETGHMVWL